MKLAEEKAKQEEIEKQKKITEKLVAEAKAKKEQEAAAALAQKKKDEEEALKKKKEKEDKDKEAVRKLAEIEKKAQAEEIAKKA